MKLTVAEHNDEWEGQQAGGVLEVSGCGAFVTLLGMQLECFVANVVGRFGMLCQPLKWLATSIALLLF